MQYKEALLFIMRIIWNTQGTMDKRQSYFLCEHKIMINFPATINNPISEVTKFTTLYYTTAHF
jgi:hypothetical protein